MANKSTAALGLAFLFLGGREAYGFTPCDDLKGVDQSRCFKGLSDEILSKRTPPPDPSPRTTVERQIGPLTLKIRFKERDADKIAEGFRAAKGDSIPYDLFVIDVAPAFDPEGYHPPTVKVYTRSNIEEPFEPDWRQFNLPDLPVYIAKMRAVEGLPTPVPVDEAWKPDGRNGDNDKPFVAYGRLLAEYARQFDEMVKPMRRKSPSGRK